jgi:hypothetical protein
MPQRQHASDWRADGPQAGPPQPHRDLVAEGRPAPQGRPRPPGSSTRPDAADVLALLCEEIGEPLEHGLAARRYAMSGDRRALHGTVL